MSKPHTPAPWYLARGNEICANGPKGQMELATVHRECEYGPNPLPLEANARLIAKAPEMKAALDNILFAVDDDMHNNNGRIDFVAIREICKKLLAQIEMED